MVLGKIAQPTLTELLEDEMEDKFGRPKASAKAQMERVGRQLYNRK